MKHASNTKAANCVLASRCNVANTVRCNGQCPHWISLHGASGLGGRSAAAGLPKDYRLVTLSNSPVAENQPKIYETLRKYASTFERQFSTLGFEVDGERIKSLYLFSESPGTGKTTSASALINEYIIANYIGSLKRSKQALGRPAYLLDVNEWQELYNGFSRKGIPQEVAERNSRPYYRQMELAKTTPFVVLDDIGVRIATDAFRGDLHSIINYRTANGLPTVYTSNIALDSGVPDKDRIDANKPYDIKDVFDARLYDRMRDQCMTLSFGGESKRGIRR